MEQQPFVVEIVQHFRVRGHALTKAVFEARWRALVPAGVAFPPPATLSRWSTNYSNGEPLRTQQGDALLFVCIAHVDGALLIDSHSTHLKVATSALFSQ